MSSLKKFIYWFFAFLIVCIVGITGVFADTYSSNQFIAWLYDNYGPTLHYTTTDLTNNRWQGTIPTMTAYSSGGAWGISSPIVLLSGHTYSLSASITGYYSGNIILSTYNNIGVGTTINNAVTSYQNNTNVNENYSTANGTIIQFAFTPTINSNFIVFPFATSVSGSNQTFWLENIIIDDLGSSGVSETTINNSLNNQTNIINNSIIASTNDITNNSNENRDAIINNQNANNEALIDSQKVCIYIDKVNITEDNKYFYYNGTTISQNSYGITDYININGGTLTIENIFPYAGSEPYMCYYDVNKVKISCQNLLNLSNPTIPNNAYYMRTSIYKPTNLPTFKLCKNGNQATTDKLDDLNSTLTDTNVDTSSLNDAVGWLPPGPVDTIINLPLTMFNSLLTSLGKTCSPLSIPLPYVDEDLEIPCLTSIFSRIEGVNSFWTWVGSIASVLILYNYLLSLYHWVDETLSLRENTMPGYYDDNFGGGA